MQTTRERETFTLRTLEEIEGIMAGVARSIEALDVGTYGLCEHCATPIAKQTLVENPLATRCDAHIVQDRPALFTLPGDANDDALLDDALLDDALPDANDDALLDDALLDGALPDANDDALLDDAHLDDALLIDALLDDALLDDAIEDVAPNDIGPA